MARDRHSRNTLPFDEAELRRLATSVGDTAQAAPARSRKADDYRPTCKIHKDDLLGLVNRSTRAASDPGPAMAELEVELQVNAAPIADGSNGVSSVPAPVTPEDALDLLEQGITSEPPELVQSAQPFSHSIAPSIELASDLQEEVTRRRATSQTTPMSVDQLAQTADAAQKIATGEMVPLANVQADPALVVADEPMPFGNEPLYQVANEPVVAPGEPALPRVFEQPQSFERGEFLMLVAVAAILGIVMAVLVVVVL